MKYRIREEIRTENGERISRFYCEHKFLWWWFLTFFNEGVDGCPGPDVFFNTKQEALTALRDHFQSLELTEVVFHEV
jgi:hypothetical protein